MATDPAALMLLSLANAMARSTEIALQPAGFEYVRPRLVAGSVVFFAQVGHLNLRLRVTLDPITAENWQRVLEDTPRD